MKRNVIPTLACLLLLCSCAYTSAGTPPEEVSEAKAGTEMGTASEQVGAKEIPEIEAGTAQPMSREEEPGNLASAPASATAEYAYEDVFMALDLPAEWEYEVQTKEMMDEENGLVLCGIDFWPAEYPEMRLEFGCWPDGIGMCGTGVTIEHIDLKDGVSAWRYTENLNGTMWLTLVYDHADDGRRYAYVLQGDMALTLWEQYEDEIMEIAATARFA